MGNTLKKERNYSIDFFKIFSMFMVVAIHVLNGVVLGSQKGTINEYVSVFLETSVLTAVNCFALASGFILINVKYKFSRIINMWFQVFFYSVLITVPFFVFIPEVCSKGILLQSCFPVLAANRYWYFSSYFVLFMLMPYINILLNHLTKKQHLTLNLILFVIFSIFPIIAFENGTYYTYKGYSFFWLAIVYIWGAYFGKHGIKSRLRTDMLAFWVCTILTFLSRFGFFVDDIPVLSAIVSRMEFSRYDSPCLVIASVALLSAFSKIKISNQALIKLINFISPLTFGIYLIHNNQLIRHQIMLKYLPSIGELNTLFMILLSLAFIIGIFTVCLFLDWLRLKLFNLIRIPLLSKKIGDFIESKAKAIANKLIKL